MKTALAVMLLGLALGSCAAFPPPRYPEAGVDYRLEVRNNPAQARFDLTIISLASRPLCLGAEHWPQEAGWLDHQGGPRIWAEVGVDHHPFKQNNGGYCLEECFAARVAPNKSASAFLPYANFIDLDQGAGALATLHFEPRPFWCR